ncbi:acylneuraminate cytidylyltransferase family protein [Flavobacterium sp. LHD-80]|uniref:acylneuraminate cytidylyltransferase family protein n=1 Tax=Flavobacterium sp. LHD-80 TaxID=3071411 RepID=UPI0027DED0B2|nr:acylneuraminate cytidylyltransferase family protein [Flavobacterium sp. LHD-80]MDQ6472088.1 acylneuraminate cytidylyltransferase family protein [Flavobacterium sp. LHD-80]
MKTIAIIPARGGSKRLPFKNILPLAGIPIVAHSILYAKANSDIIDEIYVSTDDEEIKKIAIEFGAKVINRPESISGDLEPTISALKNVLEQIEDEVENVILLQPTNPLRQEDLLKEAFNLFKSQNCESLFTVSQNHQKFGKIEKNKFIPFNYKVGQRSQDLEPIFYENGLLYITKSKLIFDDIIISENAFPFEINHIFASVDIDTQEDFEYAEYLFQKHIKP